jgi:hypothetical protein
MKFSIKLTASLLALGQLAACASPPPVVAACKTYCRSYEEGFQWAAAANLDDERNCSGYTSEFARGCRQQITDRQLSLAPARDGL